MGAIGPTIIWSSIWQKARKLFLLTEYKSGKKNFLPQLKCQNSSVSRSLSVSLSQMVCRYHRMFRLLQHHVHNSGVARNLRQGRKVVLSFPFLPSSAFPPPLLSTALLSLPSSPLPTLRSRTTPYIQPGSLGERCELPTGVWGGAPAEIEFGAF